MIAPRVLDDIVFGECQRRVRRHPGSRADAAEPRQAPGAAAGRPETHSSGACLTMTAAAYAFRRPGRDRLDAEAGNVRPSPQGRFSARRPRRRAPHVYSAVTAQRDVVGCGTVTSAALARVIPTYLDRLLVSQTATPLRGAPRPRGGLFSASHERGPSIRRARTAARGGSCGNESSSRDPDRSDARPRPNQDGRGSRRASRRRRTRDAR